MATATKWPLRPDEHFGQMASVEAIHTSLFGLLGGTSLNGTPGRRPDHPGTKVYVGQKGLSGGGGCLTPWEGSMYTSKESRVSAACSGPFAMPQGEEGGA